MVLYSTTPPDLSTDLARMLLDRRLIACANIVPVRSLYRWKGETCDEEEHLLVMKTVRSKTDAVITAIKERHSYDVPEIIALPVTAGYLPYLDWVRGETR